MSTRGGVRALTTWNPADPGARVGRVSVLEPHELERQLVAAVDSQPEWAARAARRAAALNQWADELERDGDDLAQLVAREVGKPIVEARAEVARGVAILRYYAQAAFDPTGELLPSPDGRSSLTVERHPLGTVLAIAPWNFPVAIPLWKLAPALAYGNAAIFKPSSAAAGTGARLVELAHRHVPAEVLVLAAVGRDQAQALLDDPRVAAVSFTGSEVVGRDLIVRVARRGGAVQAEMGGQNASIVLDDADISLAASTIAQAAMAYAGQKCTATSRVVVTRSVASTLTDALVAEIAQLRVGDPLDPETLVGPVISQDARQSVHGAVEDAVDRGAKILTGGGLPSDGGWFYPPTLLSVANPLDPFVQEETFGPAAAVMVAADDGEAVRIANSTRYGLSAAVFGRDLDRASVVARQLRAGLIRVNASTTGVDYYAPFGGVGASSYGPREQGRAAREFYTDTRTMLITPG